MHRHRVPNVLKRRIVHSERKKVFKMSIESLSLLGR